MDPIQEKIARSFWTDILEPLQPSINNGEFLLHEYDMGRLSGGEMVLAEVLSIDISDLDRCIAQSGSIDEFIKLANEAGPMYCLESDNGKHCAHAQKGERYSCCYCGKYTVKSDEN